MVKIYKQVKRKPKLKFKKGEVIEKDDTRGDNSSVKAKKSGMDVIETNSKHNTQK